jgi:GT2 family glycosyltransferase
MDLSVVVVTYRSREHILATLRSLEPGVQPRETSQSPLTWECVVLDNDSHDGTPELVEREAAFVRLVRTGSNLGYAKAVNLGLAATTGRYVLVLNPDCEWRPGAIDALVRYADAHPKCGIAAPRIVNTDGSLEYSARSYPSPFAFLFNRYSLLSRLWPGNPWTRRYLLSDWDHQSPRSVDWVSGAAMLVRRDAATVVGGMDETYFMFNEDIDWCRRFNMSGWTVDYAPEAETVHHIGASKGEVSNRVIRERHRGMLYYYRKYHRSSPPLDALVALMIELRMKLLVFLNGPDR